MTDLAEDFRSAFRHHPAGVSLVTALSPEGPVGLTLSSVASVSIDPPALSFSVTKAHGSAGSILTADSFVVHLLGAAHEDLAVAFATSGAERFTPEQGWGKLDTGEPFLPSARAALRARIVGMIESGSSRLVLAEVLSVHLGEHVPPLIYQDRKFFTSP